MRASSAFLTAVIAVAVWAFSACGVPNLESQTCIDARYALRTFYSFHFDVGVSDGHEQDIEDRKDFLTPQFFQALMGREKALNDPFTISDALPTTFKIGECSESGGSSRFRVQVYWRDDRATIQKDFFVTMKQQDGKWRIDEINEH